MAEVSTGFKVLVGAKSSFLASSYLLVVCGACNKPIFGVA
jgi:hypothetical protein